MNYAGCRKEAEGLQQVGNLVSEYTHKVSAWSPNEEAFDEPAQALVADTVRQMVNAPQWKDHGLTPQEKEQQVTKEDIEEALKYLSKKGKLHKAPGLDGLANWMLVWGGGATAAMLAPIFDRAWQTSMLPNCWSKALVHYIYKGKGKGGDLEVSNYRPISLLSVVAKLYTVVLLPRLAAKVGPHLVVEQGCAKPGQGHLEHLWAFMSMAEDAMEQGEENGSGMFAMFADAHKAYDQVWRDALYLILYTQGVRGKLLGSIQSWLNGAVAVAQWHGVQGPGVALEQGLRQGCVLSPILYCAFINVFLVEQPKTEIPGQFQWVTRWLYSQGIQNEKGEGTGVFCRPLARQVKAMLFMDDVTLLAKTKEGLTRIVARYLEFCRTFRIRLNPGKSTMMLFTKGTPDTTPITIGQVTVEHPKNGVQNYLGYAMDSNMTGGPQLERMAGIVAGKRLVVSAIARIMGEEVAAW